MFTENFQIQNESDSETTDQAPTNWDLTQSKGFELPNEPDSNS